jgi:hypothetical protein
VSLSSLVSVHLDDVRRFLRQLGAKCVETLGQRLVLSREQVAMGVHRNLDPRVSCSSLDLLWGAPTLIARATAVCVRSRGRVPPIPARRKAVRHKLSNGERIRRAPSRFVNPNPFTLFGGYA